MSRPCLPPAGLLIDCMNILMLHNRYLVPGGEDQSAASEAALLSEYGHHVELLEQDNRHVEELGKARTAMRTLWSRESFNQVQDKLRTGTFDIVHVQNFFPLWSPSVYYAAFERGVPVVQTLRNYRLICSNSLLFRDDKVCEDCLGRFVPWPGIFHACYRNSTAGSAVVAAMIGVHKVAGTWQKRVNTYIALTDFSRQKYIAGGLPAEKIVLKPEFVHPLPPQGGGGGGYALFVGRLSPEKGISTLLEAWRTAADPLPLKIAGGGPLQQSVIAAAQESQGKIEYLGQSSPQRTLELMRSAEFLVVPSACYEAMPRTVIESFGAGTPVVASNLGATATMISNGKTGFLVAAGDIGKLRDRIQWCSQNVANLRALRGNARAAFEAQYTGEANIRELTRIYSQAIESGKSATYSRGAS